MESTLKYELCVSILMEEEATQFNELISIFYYLLGIKYTQNELVLF